MEPTSEQELKQLLEEGRITEEEYRELLEAIRQKEKSKLTAAETIQPKSQTDWHKIVPLIFIICGVLPFVAALIIQSLFDINMVESMVMIVVVAIPVLLVIKGILWLRRKSN